MVRKTPTAQEWPALILPEFVKKVAKVMGLVAEPCHFLLTGLFGQRLVRIAADIYGLPVIEFAP